MYKCYTHAPIRVCVRIAHVHAQVSSPLVRHSIGRPQAGQFAGLSLLSLVATNPTGFIGFPQGLVCFFCIFRSSNVSEKKEIYKERRIAPVGELCELSGIATTNDSDTTPLYIARAMRTHTRLYNTYTYENKKRLNTQHQTV